jgi:ergothioneine biosynthesis protein EgtB
MRKMSVTVSQPAIREQLLLRLAESRSVTDELFRIVHADAFYDRPIAERHRLIFYIGHLEAFDWNLIADHALGLSAAHNELNRLFAFGIDPVGVGLPQDKPSDWPQFSEIKAYNRRTRENVDGILEDHSRSSAYCWQYPQEVILNVAIEHRLMHAETLAYMLHELSFKRKILPRNYQPVDTRSRSPIASRMIDIPAGLATLGIPRGGNMFGWDNEFEEHSIEVSAFAIGAHKVTNREFLQFVREGGYDDRHLWSATDWVWIKEQNISHPHFWLKHEDKWFYRAMFEEVQLPLDWPVYISHAEATAYARFRGQSLPTEAQFHRAAYGTRQGTEHNYPWGDEPPDARRGNFDFQCWDPVAVGTYPEGRSAFGLEDAIGNGWEWTSSSFAPYSGFEPFRFYSGYSANFFDQKHFVVKGASPRTAACMLRRSFRNWFQPHYPYVYASFRCVDN